MIPTPKCIGEGVLSPDEPSEISAEEFWILLDQHLLKIQNGEIDFVVSGPSLDSDSGDEAQ